MPAVSQRTLKQGSMEDASHHVASFDLSILDGIAPGSGDRGDPRRKKSQPHNQPGVASPYSPVVRVQGSGVSLNPPMNKLGSGRIHNATTQPVHVKAGFDMS